MTLAEKMIKECKKTTCEKCKYRDICLRLDWRICPEEWCDKMVAQYDILFKKIVEEWKE